MKDHSIKISLEVMQRLLALNSEPKFHAEWNRFYPGAPDEDIRRRSEQSVNVMLGRLREQLPKHPQKSFVLSQFLEMLKEFEHDDTEEREHACGYCERVMEILHIESSDGLLNTWLYGFDI